MKSSPLGKAVRYVTEYDPGLLHAIPRTQNWTARGLEARPFQGCDIWNAYELSWLNARGLPQVAVGEFRVPADSKNLIESKSFKLYLNSFNQTRLASWDEVAARMRTDLTACADADVEVVLRPVQQAPVPLPAFGGVCLDAQDIAIDCYEHNAGFLKTLPGDAVQEVLYSDLLRSNCPVTGQPDWGSVSIAYRGARICHEGLLRYIVSLREHTGFHEQCVETLFLDIMARCQPVELTVYARYMRRGGLDINPYRSTRSESAPNTRLARQ